MTPYKGIIRISCKRKTGCIGKSRDNVQPECMACAEAITHILDLDDKVLFESRALEVKTGKRKAKSKR